MVETGAEAERSALTELDPPLHDAINPDASDALVDTERSVPHREAEAVTFPYGYSVAVDSGGQVHLE